LRFNSSLQLVADNATLRSRATPRVSRDIRCLGRIALVGRAAERVRRKEKFHALDVPGWCAVPLIHVTTAYPFRAWRHSNLIARAVIPDCCTNGVTPMEEIIAWLR
jgi:hypothetical protein